jgi:DNA modification methylase
LLDVFSEVHRVLNPSGTLWLNIGDSYAGSGRGKGDVNVKGKYLRESYVGCMFDKPYRLEGYKNKDLIGIPWMLAFALRKAGWFLRQDIIWSKPNAMPESIKDRCTKAHEYLFLLAKSARYYFNHEAILEPTAYDGRKDTYYKGGHKDMAGGAHERWPHKIRGYAKKDGETGLFPSHHGNSIPTYPARNKRDVWTVNTCSFPETHFATYPPGLIVPCIKAGCPEGGIVLDPFIGSGTTAVVARKLNRNFIGIELNPEYIKIAERRLRNELGMWL